MKNESRKERRKAKKKREKQKNEKREEAGKREGKRTESPSCLLFIRLQDITYTSIAVTIRWNAPILSRRRRLRIFRIILPVLIKTP